MIAREGNIAIAKFNEGEIMENLRMAMRELNAKSAIIINGIGQLENSIIGYFDGENYIKKKIEEPVELVSLQGNIGMDGKKHIIHAHAALALKDGTILGGHLMTGNVKIVNEIVLYILGEIKIERRRKGMLMEMFIS